MEKEDSSPRARPAILRHSLFAIGFIVAVLAAMRMALIFAMSECQLSPTQELIDECFARSALNAKVHVATVAVLALLSVALHVLDSRWTWLGLVMIPIAPVLAIFAVSPFIA